MKTTAIPANVILPGIALVLVNAVLIATWPLTDNISPRAGSTVLMVVFAFGHGALRYGWRTTLLFALLAAVVSSAFEAASIATGFPFGSYHYSDLLAARIGPVPANIPLAYFAMGYLSWSIAGVLLGKRDGTVTRTEVILLPVLAAFVMVMWDMSMDPFNATIAGYWQWHAGGAYFGVPFSNFIGWYLCVFTFCLAFAVVLRLRPSASAGRRVDSRAFWALPVLMYLSRTLEYWGNWLFRESATVTDRAGHVWHTRDITGSLLLVSLSTMVFVSLLSLILIARSDAEGR